MTEHLSVPLDRLGSPRLRPDGLIADRRTLAKRLGVEPCAIATTKLPSPAPAAKTPRIAVLGDSICHGVQALGVAHPEHSWPALVAGACGAGPISAPAMPYAPFNLDEVVDRLSRSLAPDDAGTVSRGLLVSRVLRIAALTADALDDAPRPDDASANLGVTGYQLADVLRGSAPSRPSRLARALATVTNVRELLDAHERVERSVLGAHPTATEALRARISDEPAALDLLIVALGANCALRAFIDGHPRWADSVDQWRVADGTRLWRPALFAAELDRLLDQIDGLEPAPRTVLVVTVPHVTVAPLVSAVPGERLPGLPDYARAYVPRWEQPARHSGGATLTGEEVALIDETIDDFNRLLANAVNGRADRSWLLFDLCGLLDAYAYVRNRHPGATERPRPFPATPAQLQRKFGKPSAGGPSFDDPADSYLDTRYPLVEVKAGRRRLLQGGLVSVDGAHPTSAGYGLIAHHALLRLQTAGVTWVPDGAGEALPWGELLADRLVAGAFDVDAVPAPALDPFWSRIGAVVGALDVLRGVASALAPAPVRFALRRIVRVARALRRRVARLN